jgi:uncharacterized membrane protein
MIHSLFVNLKSLVHPMLVHFPIALLFASVTLDWIGFWLNHAGLTRAGFYTLVLGALGAGMAALSGPDQVTGTAVVNSLFVNHQNFALLTVSLAVSMVVVRLFAVDGISGVWAFGYLLCTLALVTVVSFTGYFGGELVYHQAIGVTLPAGASLPAGTYAGRPLLPVKPVVALLGFLCVVGLGFWIMAGRMLVPRFYGVWWRAVRQDRLTGGAIWTLRKRAAQPAPALGRMSAPMHFSGQQLSDRRPEGSAASPSRRG